MIENKEYWSSAEDKGSVKISEDVINTIALVATNETDGVASVFTSVTSDIASLLGKKVSTKAVNSTFVDDNVEIAISIVVNFGISVFDTAKSVQENVKSAIESMTGLVCDTINVTVSGISFEK